MQRKNVRGSLPDVMIFTIKTLVGAVAFILVGFLMVQFAHQAQTTPLNDTATGAKANNFIISIGEDNIGTYFVILFVFDLLGIIFTSFLITLSPIFFVFYIIMISFALAISVFSMTFYNRISEISMLAAYIGDQTYINFVIQYAPIFTLVAGILSAIIIMAKPDPNTGTF